MIAWRRGGTAIDAGEDRPGALELLANDRGVIAR